MLCHRYYDSWRTCINLPGGKKLMKIQYGNAFVEQKMWKYPLVILISKVD